MPLYEAINLLYSDSQGKYIHPGETIELDGEIEKILLESGNVKPATIEYQVPLAPKVRKVSKRAKGTVITEAEPEGGDTLPETNDEGQE